MGGAIIDVDCRTAVDGLLVAGEDAGGVHGANRLGGNGVAESTVFGARAGEAAARIARERNRRVPDRAQVAASAARAFAPLEREIGPSPFDVTAELKSLMWEKCGLVRDRAGLEQARMRLEALTEQAEAISAPGPAKMNFAWQEALDVRNQLAVAHAIVVAALAREESRGAHYRSDFPQQNDEAWLRYLVMARGADGRSTLTSRPVELSRARPERDLAGGARR